PLPRAAPTTETRSAPFLRNRGWSSPHSGRGSPRTLRQRRNRDPLWERARWGSSRPGIARRSRLGNLAAMRMFHYFLALVTWRLALCFLPPRGYQGAIIPPTHARPDSRRFWSRPIVKHTHRPRHSPRARP